jgi:hypothetical protein
MTETAARFWGIVMTSKRQPRYDKKEFARRGEALFESEIRPKVAKRNPRHFLAIDIESGAYEVDKDEIAACDRLLVRIPDAQIWLRKVGSRFARRFGGRGNVGLVDWLLACPEKGFFTPIDSETTDTL